MFSEPVQSKWFILFCMINLRFLGVLSAECQVGVQCDECELTIKEGKPCTRATTRWPVYFCSSTTGLITQADTSYLYCDIKQRWLREGKCPKGSYFGRQSCVDVNSLRFNQAFSSGSGRTGDFCQQNTDCLSLYCRSGVCSCASSSVQIGNDCFAKIQPGDTGCVDDRQCDSVWPGARCSQGVCVCAKDYRVETTRDGAACVRNTQKMSSCAVPFVLEPANVDQANLGTLTALRQGGTNNLLTCNQQATGNAVAATCNNAGEIYDCLHATNAAGQADQFPNRGICCPTRAFACSQPRMTGGTAGALQRYHYDTASATCQQFTFNSAGATNENTNANNFNTYDHCMSYCQSACTRGTPIYGTTVDNQGNTAKSCTSNSNDCPFDYECSRSGSSLYCCPKTSFVCSLNGGRTYIGQNVPATADMGFLSQSLVTVTRFWFNPTAARCEGFQYAGAGGNFNNFNNRQDCENYCLQELCQYGSPLLNPSGEYQQCSQDSDCPQAFSCGSNAKSTNINVCCPLAQTICAQSKVVGTCTNWVRKYWHNPDTRECEQFEYSGCGGNSNNFETAFDCQVHCRDTTVEPNCVQGQALKDSFGKYYSCSTTDKRQKCPSNYECYFDAFVYGCCPTKTYTCSQSADPGRVCGPATARWTYDSALHRCISLTYHGCDGNSNNFATSDGCNRYCGTGGCPDGGEMYREPNGRQVHVCQSQAQCPNGYLCTPIVDGTFTSKRCCPTKAQICGQPPNRDDQQKCASSIRFFFNKQTQKCSSFTDNSCSNNANNFATMAQCSNFCQSAACLPGEIALLDLNQEQARQCNQMLTTSCPKGYTCRYDTLAKRSVCCGSTDMDVCKKNERAFVDALNSSPKECLPNVENSCPAEYSCSYSNTKAKYYCCSGLEDQAGLACKNGRALYFPVNDATRAGPLKCTVGLISRTCPTDYTCVGAKGTSMQGFCCSVKPLCLNGEEFSMDEEGKPLKCIMGGVQQCSNGYACQTTRTGSTIGHCCKFSESMAAEASQGCPPGQFAHLDASGNVIKCDAFSMTSCPVAFSCQWSSQNNNYQCCGATPTIPKTINSSPGLGCPQGQVAYINENTGQRQQCDSLFSQQCPVGYFCQYSTTRSVIQCCGVRADCPTGQVAAVAMDGMSVACQPNGRTCAPGFQCVRSLSGSYVCCAGGSIRRQYSNSNTEGTTSTLDTRATPPTFGVVAGNGVSTKQPIQRVSPCEPRQLFINGQCYQAVPTSKPHIKLTIGSACSQDSDCMQTSVCRFSLCSCADGQVYKGQKCVKGCSQGMTLISERCLSTMGVGSSCSDTRQCPERALCILGICKCAEALVYRDGKCLIPEAIEPDHYETCGANYEGSVSQNNTITVCTSNSFMCSPPYKCRFSPIKQQYYCCKERRLMCAPGNELLYPVTGTPLTCTQKSNCPQNGTCLLSEIDSQTWVCCVKEQIEKNGPDRLFR